MSEPIILLAGGRLTEKFRASHAESPTSAAEVHAAFARHRSGALWVAPKRHALFTAFAQVPTSGTRKHRLLLLGRPGASELEYLSAKFEHVVTPEAGIQLLPKDQLLEVVASRRRAELLIGVAVAFDSVMVVRGDLESVMIPKAWFKTRRGGPTVDFSDLEVIDGGQTVRLGEFEAASDAILYEFDPAFRRRERRRRLDADKTLGGAIRRLRLQKGLPRTAFLPQVSEKEIARLERGEVKKPHQQTLASIAARLEVEPEQLASY